MITKERLSQSLEGRAEPVKVSFFYKLSLVIVALGMILLPLIYLSIIVFIAYWVIMHATNPGYIFSGNDPSFWRLFYYATPIIVGPILVFFMIKPLFTNIEKPSLGVEVTEKDEPVLFYFIDMICKSVNAPLPSKVLLYTEPNAAASFQNGILSFWKNDLELTIGLPLASSMSVSQLGGILAHEFGHFSQGTAMRVTYLIRSLNNWFYRLVYERDSWDEKLEQWSSKNENWFGIILHLSRFGVFVSRCILFGLMFFGNLISSLMLRQMEYDADQYEIRFAGSNEFIKTTRDLNLISYNWSLFMQNIFENWSNRSLSGNIPKYLSHKMGRINPEIIEEVKQQINNRETEFLDTHPSDKARIKKARAKKLEGVFRLNEPAVGLFVNFEEHAKAATQLFYVNLMGKDFKEEYLVDNEQFKTHNEAQEANDKALSDFYAGVINMHFPIDFEKVQAEFDAEKHPPHQAIKIIQKLADLYQKKKEPTERLINQKFELLDDISGWYLAHALLKFGIEVDKKDFKLEEATIGEAKKKVKQAVILEKKIDKEYSLIRKSVRLLFAVLINSGLLPEQELKHINRMASTEAQLKAHYPHFRKLMNKFSVVVGLTSNMHLLGNDESLITKCDKMEFALKKDLKSFHSVLKESPHPFNEKGNVGDYLFPDGFHKMDTEKMTNTVLTLNSLYAMLYNRVVGEIGLQAMKVLDQRKS